MVDSKGYHCYTVTMRNITRPSCESVDNGNICGDPAHLVRTCKDGVGSWRRTDGKWICSYHHYQNCPNSDPTRMYTLHKKSYCENVDGRLGKFCTTTITHPKELTVDHIDGNHKNDDPSNLQTLCACCHNLKTHQDYANRGSLPRVESGMAIFSNSELWGLV